jgi:hypothetical protein
MSTNRYAVITSNDQLDCFGDFNKNNPLCAKHCAIRLGCAIELNNNVRIEILEELMASEGSLVKYQ